MGSPQVIEAVREEVKKQETVEKDLTEKAGENVIEDKAVDLKDETMEQHMAQLFSRPAETKKEESAVVHDKSETITLEIGQILSRQSRDNSVKDVTDTIKDKEDEEPEKIPQKNGSSKH